MLSKERLRVHLATKGCSALLADLANAEVCAALLAVALVWLSKLEHSLLASVMTACFNSSIILANGRRRL